ncbi:MAG: hypothetical protein GX417_04590 [Clostridiales bacterium]|nr:hypothetical protein [Clostridiales bacterium]
MDQRIFEYLTANETPGAPRYLLARLLRGGSSDAFPVSSGHYRPLLAEQRADGGYGRFHSMDSQDKTKRVFPTTEQAVRRMRDLDLPKSDPVRTRAARALLGYAQGTLAYSDRVEKHPDFGITLASMAAANLALLGEDCAALDAAKRACAALVEAAAEEIESGGAAYAERWQRTVYETHVLTLRPETTHVLWLLDDNRFLDAGAEACFLAHLWNKSVYYTRGIPAGAHLPADSRYFSDWLSVLELFMGTRGFARRMEADGTDSFLEGEAMRLAAGAAVPRAGEGPVGRYREGRRTADGLVWDTVFRIARILAAAGRN